MADRKINKRYIENFSTVVFTQPLSKGRKIEEIYSKTPKGWLLMYSSNSAYHICPYDGVFRDCKECGVNDADFSMDFCLNKRQYFSSAALIERIDLCKKADLPVKFME